MGMKDQPLGQWNYGAGETLVAITPRGPTADMIEAGVNVLLNSAPWAANGLSNSETVRLIYLAMSEVSCRTLARKGKGNE